jgi:CRP-like cAMP-binding protein
LTPALILQVPEQVVQRFLELAPHVRHFFDRLNSANSIRSILKRMSLFQGVSESDIHMLAQQAQIQHYGRNEHLFTEDDLGEQKRPARETLHILLEGFVKVSVLLPIVKEATTSPEGLTCSAMVEQ